MLGLYVHIPFCDKICRYCDFAKVYTDVMDHQQYLESLRKEYLLYKDSNNFVFDTVYFGGGTPSALDEQSLITLLEIFKDEIQQADEITFEANPESLNERKIMILKSYGVNRISLGVQTFDEKSLRFLNRGHSNQQVRNCFTLLRKHGIDNINLDLIYALPNQTLAAVHKDIEAVFALQPTHISTYALIFEPHTVLYLKQQAGKELEVDDTLQEEMYRLLRHKFKQEGYQQYEFSNWAKANNYSKHNTKYWDLTEYLGLGLGSHGFFQGRRYANTRSIVHYKEQLDAGEKPLVEDYLVTQQALMEEMLFLGLRMVKGVEKQAFFQRFHQSITEVFGTAIQKHLQLNNIVETKTHYRLSDDALFVSNEILSDFLL